MFKVGDVVRLVLGTQYAKDWPDEFIVTEIDTRTARIKRRGETHSMGGYYYHRLELVVPVDKQATVIAKIKELNERYLNRRASV